MFISNSRNSQFFTLSYELYKGYIPYVIFSLS